MRFARSGALTDGGQVFIRLDGETLSISDNGIGMSETVLRENFWKAGSSGKNSDEARKAGVVGTFGIGAMANFGVCRRLKVETRAEGSDNLLISVADRDGLKIAEECISFESIDGRNREVGTTLTVELDPTSAISSDRARTYLRSYVGMLPVPVHFNDELISQQPVSSLLRVDHRSFTDIGTIDVRSGAFVATCTVEADPNGQVMVRVTNIQITGTIVEGSLALLQGGGQLMGLRSYFGLAPVPVTGPYQFGGWANLSFLRPTAGREALSRESIDQVASLILCAEYAASDKLSKTEFADRNTSFIQWVANNQKWEFADKITVHAWPDDADLELGAIQSLRNSRAVQYYSGTDKEIIQTFANESSVLLQLAQGQLRRRIQLQKLRGQNVAEVPDSVQTTHIYRPEELSQSQLAVLLRISAILRDDYLIPDVEALFVEMSHGVTILADKAGDRLRIQIALSSAIIPPLLEVRETAPELFGQFMKDFVRNHIYQKVQQHVPSSTRGGVDALRKLLLKNRELYRYEDSELGDLEGVLGDFLSGQSNLGAVVERRRYGWSGGWSGQSQRVSSEQVGSVEEVVPDVVESPVTPEDAEGEEREAAPPILRENVASEMKILATDSTYSQLNGFRTFLGLSDRLMQTEAPFFREPHSTRVIWAGHRVIYIFTNATGELSLYYDIELRNPLEQKSAGGGTFPTTTLITKKRIFIPVPSELSDEFRVETGSREFFVRFDLLSNDSDSRPA
jgi:molecular chaperone HtpG